MLILEKTIKDIKSLKIQSATGVAQAAAQALASFANTLKAKNKQSFLTSLRQAAKQLGAARPNEPAAENGLDYIIYGVEKVNIEDVQELKKIVKAKAQEFLKQVERSKKLISGVGIKVIKNNDNIFTHCHTSSVIGILKEAKLKGKNFEVFNTETRPLYQGHKTATELLQTGIKTTMVADSAAAFVISSASGRDLMMDVILLGADVLLPDGGAINKIGSYGIALAAQVEEIPVFVVSSVLKMDKHLKSLAQVKIERRPAKEIWDKAPKDLKMINFAFDKIPAHLITAYITEFGIIKPSKMAKLAKKKMYWA